MSNSSAYCFAHVAELIYNLQESRQEIEEVQGERAELEAQQVRLVEEMKATDILTQKLKVGGQSVLPCSYAAAQLLL